MGLTTRNVRFRTLGNVLVNPAVALLFIVLDVKPGRLRVHGGARRW